MASLVVPLGAFVLIFWLLIVRPQARRQGELRAMQEALSVGDEVMLTSGIHGTVSGLDDDVASVEVAPGVIVRVARAAIGRRITDPVDENPSDTSVAEETP